MKRSVAIVAIVFVAFVIGYALFFSEGKAPPASRVTFLFLHFTNTAAGEGAVFTMSNHSGSIALNFARIEERTASGWKPAIPGNTSVRPCSPGFSVPVSATNVPWRVIFDGAERPEHFYSRSYRSLIERLYPNSSSIHWCPFSVTNDVVGTANP